MSNYTDFLKISHDFLMLINEKVRRGELNKTIAKEAETLEWFYMEVEKLFKSYEDDLHLVKLELVQHKVIAKLLEKELKQAVEAAISKEDKDLEKVLRSTNFDIDISKPVSKRKREKLPDNKFGGVKKRFNDGVPLEAILKHYELTEKQLIELVDKKVK